MSLRAWNVPIENGEIEEEFVSVKSQDLSCLELRALDLDVLCLTYRFQPRKITKLILYGNCLNVLPSCISHFSNLKELDASSNEICWICGEIADLRKLYLLELRNNCFYSLPKEFQQCLSLQVLNLGGNLFTEFPPQIFELQQLRELYFGGNKIVNVPPSIEKLQSLEILYLGGNQITTVSSHLRRLKRLRHLTLCDNKLESIPQELGQLKNLESLSLHRNHLQTLPMEILMLVNLQELTLRDNPLVNTFVRKLEFSPPSLLELCGRVIKIQNIAFTKNDLPRHLCSYLNSAKCCVNPKCGGVYFDSRVKSVRFVDFCGRFRLPLEQYLCSPCEKEDLSEESEDVLRIQKVLLPSDVVDSE